ncbi:MAG: UDP-N-acetylglucosamine 1-carboxyvinyltransferase [Parcubacteria group bacterium]|nr:UDP-N-acetylglucosamine 1-carboxyvinyltransferase [Parcubacteria group bacterium]
MARERFLIKGLGGAQALSGSIAVKGAKNAALKALASSILFEDGITLNNVPDIEDVKRMNDILSALGVVVSNKKEGEYALSVPGTLATDLPVDLAQKMRASIVLTGPILSRFGKVSFPHPGGCVIGERPIDLFLSGFEAMGARVTRESDRYTLFVPDGRLSGTSIFFKKPSVTATETLIMAATLAKGETIIKNAAREPEIGILADFLNSCGARIRGAGDANIYIEGGGLLSGVRDVFHTPSDRIETGSFLILGALAGVNFEIKNCNPKHVEALTEILRQVGVAVDVGKNSIMLSKNAHPSSLTSVDIETREYPGFPTDLQAPMTVFLTQTSGQSLVFETIFEGRLSYVEELVRMGADIKALDPHRVIVRGPKALKGREMESPDLRAGLAFVIAAIVAKGDSVIHNVYNIDRGYEKIEERLRGVGVDIKRIGP